MTKSCDRWSARLGARLFESLAPEEAAELEAHLNSCTACRASWERVRPVFTALEGVSIEGSPRYLKDQLLQGLVARLSSNALAEIVQVRGSARRQSATGAPLGLAETGHRLAEGESLDLADGALALLRLANVGEIWLRGGTLLHFAGNAGRLLLNLTRGELLAAIRPGSGDLSVQTPSGLVAVTGTIFSVAVSEIGHARVGVLRGSVEARSRGGRAAATARQILHLAGSDRPPRRTSMTKQTMHGMTAWAAPMPGDTPLEIDWSDNGARPLPWAWWAALVALGLVVLTALWLWSPLGSRGSRNVSLASTAAAAAGDPLTLRSPLLPQSRWSERVHMESKLETTFALYELDEIPRVDEMLLDIRVLDAPGGEPLRLRSDAREAQSWLVIDGERRSFEEMGQLDPRQSLIGASVVDRVDPGGVVALSAGHDPILNDESDALLRALFVSIRYDLPDTPIRVGERWTRELAMPDTPGSRVRWTSTLDRVEDFDGERVAVIFREGHLDFHGPVTRPSPPIAGVEPREVLHRLQVDLTAESRFLIGEGRWLDHRFSENRTEDFTPLAGALSAPAREDGEDGTRPERAMEFREYTRETVITLADFLPPPRGGN